jgi:hypothetical protein
MPVSRNAARLVLSMSGRADLDGFAFSSTAATRLMCINDPQANSALCAGQTECHQRGPAAHGLATHRSDADRSPGTEAPDHAG